MVKFLEYCMYKDLYSFDKLQSAKLIFQTDDRSHPGVYNYLTMKDTLVEGQIKTLNPH